MRATRPLFPLIGLTLLVLVGCGQQKETQRSAPLPPLRGPEPPRDASPLLRAVYRNFQPPLPNPRVPGSGKAIGAGKKACRGKTPAEVKRRFLAESRLTADQRRALGQLPGAEAHPTADFVAGQLAALVYEGTLARARLPEYGYQGCVYALAVGLKRELSP